MIFQMEFSVCGPRFCSIVTKLILKLFCKDRSFNKPIFCSKWNWFVVPSITANVRPWGDMYPFTLIGVNVIPWCEINFFSSSQHAIFPTTIILMFSSSTFNLQSSQKWFGIKLSSVLSLGKNHSQNWSTTCWPYSWHSLIHALSKPGKLPVTTK